MQFFYPPSLDETEYEYSGSDDDESHGQGGKPLDLAAGSYFSLHYLLKNIKITH